MNARLTDPREARTPRRAWRRGQFPPADAPAAPRFLQPAVPGAWDGAEDERLVRLDDLPEDVRACRPEVSR